jgi:erythronate-4-phosphate dehydrogenase
VKILADAGIPHLTEAFASLGDVVCADGRAIGPSDVKDADALIVRTLTRVDERLLAGSRVRFVGSATAGLDHVDQAYLAARGIELASAAGANANAVAEYVLAALYGAIAAETNATTEDTVVGVVGFGNVGRRLVRYLRALGHEVVVSDPLLARQLAAGRFVETGPLADLVRAESFVDLDRLVAVSGVVSLHVPLTHDGPDPTHHMFDAARLASLRELAFLVNTSRGAVVDNAALEEVGPRRSLEIVLDVWEHEPHLKWSLLSSRDLVRVATPHVAGYSRDAKSALTCAVHVALCRFLGRPPSWQGAPRARGQRLCVDLRDAGSTTVAFARCVDAASGITKQDRRLRHLVDLPTGKRAPAFDALRREKVERLEFRHHHVDLAPEHVARGVNRTSLRRSLEVVGFPSGSSTGE